ncbi:MAG: ABC transporter permease [Chloroflexi bacterium]|jgi:peptide/nickel transport system permease protein|nr:ABC transporter permease [Chloroflexota bacterium]|tara:strand:+ start:2493 stop:3410 length:918 start_codon:yes stop_codon:yes gene_type:complete
MQRFIVHRFLQGILVVIAVMLIVFTLSRLTGDPVYLILGDEAYTEDIEALRERLGLDKPLIVQLGVWMGNLVQGDAGTSIKYKEPVFTLFFRALPNTMKLAGVSVVIALVAAIPLGVIAAVKRGTFIDSAAAGVAVFGLATPNFWIALVLMFIFSVQLGWLPVARMGGPSHYVLPAIALGTALMAGVMRLVRSSMLEVLDSEYVKLARIKGLSEGAVYWRHCLRNALIPVLTLTGLMMAGLVSGALVTETVFAWPGVGRLTYDAVRFRDYELLQASIVIQVMFVVFVNLIVDVLYAVVDPRIRYT